MQSTQDQQGNTIEYRYEEHVDGTFAGNDQTVPAHETEQLYTAWASHPQISQIIYGGNLATSGNRTISFSRERLWNDSAKWAAVRFGWNAGAPFSIDNRVTKISLSYEGQELRNYRLEFSPGARSQLTKLYECALGHCKQPTTFTYKEFEIPLLPLPTDASGTDALEGHSLNSVQSIFDADGSGRNDLLLNPVLDPLLPADCLPKTDAGKFHFARATGNHDHPYVTSIIPNVPSGAFLNCDPATATDLDNDGKTEVYLSSSDSTHSNIFYKLQHQSSGSWTVTLSGTDVPYGVDYNGDGRLEQRPNTSLFDIDTDGDGVANQVDRGPTLSATEVPFLAAYFPAGSNNWISLGVARPEPEMSASQADAFIRENMQMPDSCFNWDTWRCTKWYGPIPVEGFCTRKVYKPGCDFRGYTLKYWASALKVLDVNGDGLRDLVSWDVSTSQTGGNEPSLFMNIWYNTGRNKFVRQPVATGLSSSDRDTLNRFLNSGAFHQAFAYDINRDGSQELILIDTVNRDVYALGTGGQYQALKLSLVLPHGSRYSIPQWFTEKSRTLVVDVDSDGVPDVLFGEGSKVAIGYGEMPEHGLLESVTDGNGRTDTLTYSSGRSLLNYTPGEVHFAQSAPALVLPPTVASRTITASGEGIRTERYSYEDGRVGYYGRGFLGYTGVNKQVRVKNTSSGASTLVADESTYYHPDYFFNSDTGTHAPTLYLYYAAGRPWKRVVTTFGITSGLGSSARSVNRTVTETRTLRSMLSDAYVPMWLPHTDTVETSESDTNGSKTIISTAKHTVEFDKYAQPTTLEYVRKRNDGTLDESRKTTITYKRDQAFLDRWLLSLVEATTQVVENSTESVTRNDELDYYADGKLSSITRQPDDTNLAFNTTFHYNDRGNLTNTIETANGVTRETDFFYDSAGDLLQYTLNPLLQSTSFAHFRGYGQIAGIQDPNGLVMSRRIDAFGRLIQSTNANGISVETSYEFPGTEASFLTSQGREVVMAVRTKGPGLPTIVAFYDHYGRHIGRWYGDDDGVVRRSQVHYDILGRRSSRSHLPFADNGESEYRDQVTFDNLNRPVSVTVASDVGWNHQAPLVVTYGRPSEVSGISSAIQATAVSAVRTTFSNSTNITKLLDAHGRTVAMVDRNGAVLTYTYSPLGQLRYFTDAAGLTVENRYDAYGRPTYCSDPIRGVSSTTYTPLGDAVVRTTPTGNVTRHYDLLGRLLDETSPEGTTTWSYDAGAGAIGRLVQVDGPPTASAPLGHQIRYGYGAASDPAGVRGQVLNVTSTIAGESFAVDFDYDSLARVKTIQYPSVGGIRYAISQHYSWGSRMHKVVGSYGTSSQTLWEMLEIDALGRETSERAMDAMTTKYSYTAVEGLVRQLTTTEASTERLQLTYAYDIEDNVTTVARRENGSDTQNSRYYEYDPSGRQTGEYIGIVGGSGVSKGSQVGYVDYLQNGNINSKLEFGQYKYEVMGNPYAVTAAGENQYEYDSEGRQISRSGPNIVGGQMALTWTSFDSPNTITIADGTSTRYEYNGLKQKVLEVDGTQRKFSVSDLYQRIDNLADGSMRHSIMVRAGGRRVAEITFEEAASGVVSPQPAAAVVSDRLGSAVLTRLSASDYRFRQFASYGKGSDSSVMPSGEGFAGYVHDDEIGLSWMSNRLYDPMLGRVLAADPIISPAFGQDGANRYAYVYNRPTALTDPSGFVGGRVVFPQATEDHIYGHFENSNGTPPGAEASPVDAPTTGLAEGPVASPAAETGTTSGTGTSTALDASSQNDTGGDPESVSIGGPFAGPVSGVWQQAESNSMQNRMRANPLELRHNASDWTGFSPVTPIQANASASVDSHPKGTDVLRPASERSFSPDGVRKPVEILRQFNLGGTAHYDTNMQRKLYTHEMAVLAVLDGTVLVGTIGAGAGLAAEGGVVLEGHAIIGGMDAVADAIATGAHSGAERMLVDSAKWAAMDFPAKVNAVEGWISGVIQAGRPVYLAPGQYGIFTEIELGALEAANWGRIGNYFFPPF